MKKKLGSLYLFEAKGHVSADLNGKRGYGPTPAAALRDLADNLDRISGNARCKTEARP